MKLLAPFVLIAIALAVVIQLDDTPPDADLVFVNRSDVFTLDPQRQSYIQDFRMTNALFEGLLRWDNGTFEIIPAAADLPEVSPDGLVYTFHLRPHTRWSNGDPVTAHDFTYAWQRLLLPDTSADYSNMMFVVRGAESFWHWRARQTRAFAARPWRDGQAVTARAVRNLVHRLESILAADPRPAGLAWPPGVSDAALRADLTRLRACANRLAAAEADLEIDPDDPDAEPDPLAVGQLETERSSVALALGDGTAARRVVEALDDPASRRAEARWMWREAMQRFEQTVGLRAVDDRTLRVTLRQPCAYFLDLICFGVFFPVYRPCVEGWPDVSPDRGVDAGRGWIARAPPDFDDCRWVSLDPVSGRLEQQHQWARPYTLVCNGPYVLTQWRYKRDMRLERSETYRDQNLIQSDVVVAITIEDANTRVLAFESGGIDWLSEVGAEYEADMLAERQAYLDHYPTEVASMSLKQRPEDEILAALPPPGPGERRNVHKFPTFGTDFYGFNCRERLSDGRVNPFADAHVRRAFVLSVNKESIVQNVTRLNEPVMTSLIPPDSIPGYESPPGLPFDRERALAELTDLWVRRDSDGLLAKASDESVLFPIVEILWTTNTPRYKWISLELKSQWEQALGVRVELRGVDTKFYKEDLKQGNFMIARGRWYGDYGDPTTFLDLCKSTDGNNDRKYASIEVDRLLREAEEELDPQARLALLAECERIIVQEDVPMLVLCQLVQVYMYEPGKLTGLSQHPRLTQYLWQMEVKK